MSEQLLHEDNKYSQRLNFFLVFESVLLGTIGAIYSRATCRFPVAAVSCPLRPYYYNSGCTSKPDRIRGDALKIRTNAAFPEYMLANHERRRAPFSVSWLYTYLLPLLVASVWLGLCPLLGFDAAPTYCAKPQSPPYLDLSTELSTSICGCGSNRGSNAMERNGTVWNGTAREGSIISASVN